MIVVNWLNANRILFNAKKTEMVIFKSKKKKFEEKRLYPIYKNLSWQHHVNAVSIKLRKY